MQENNFNINLGNNNQENTSSGSLIPLISIIVIVGIAIAAYFIIFSSKKEDTNSNQVEKEKPGVTIYANEDFTNEIGDFSVTVNSLSDNVCGETKSCKGKISVFVEMGMKGKIKKYTLETNGKKVDIEGTNYKAEAAIEDGVVVIYIYGLTM